MKGYWRNDAATAETLNGGWLHTGDIAEIDGDGYITITGRKKDMIVNSGGDNISPLPKLRRNTVLSPRLRKLWSGETSGLIWWR